MVQTPRRNYPEGVKVGLEFVRCVPYFTMKVIVKLFPLNFQINIHACFSRFVCLFFPIKLINAII